MSHEKNVQSRSNLCSMYSVINREIMDGILSNRDVLNNIFLCCDHKVRNAISQVNHRLRSEMLFHIQENRDFCRLINAPDNELLFDMCEYCGQWRLVEGDTQKHVCHLHDFESHLLERNRYKVVLKEKKLIITFRLDFFRLRCLVSHPFFLHRQRLTSVFVPSFLF